MPLKQCKGAGAVADGVLFPTVHFTKGDVITIGLKNRVIAMALITAHGPNKLAGHYAFKHFVMAIGPSQNQGAPKLRLKGRLGAAGLHWLEWTWYKLRQLKAKLTSQADKAADFSLHCQQLTQAWQDTNAGTGSPVRPW